MLRRADITGRSTVSLGMLMAVVIGSVCGSYLLVPSQEQLRERVFKDSVGGDILRLIDEGAFGDKAEARAEFGRLTAEQLLYISRISRLTARERVRQVFDPSHRIRYDSFIHYFVVGAVQYVDVVKPDEAFAMITPVADRVPDKFRLQLYRLLARNALATNQPQVAVNILRQASSTDSADWDTISSLVSAERWTDHPEKARAALKEWLEKRKSELDGQLYSEAHEMLYKLALEANQPAEAMELCIAGLRETPEGGALPLDLLEKAFTAASYAGKSGVVLPWIERHLASFADDQLDWSALLERKRQGVQPDTNYLMWTTRASQAADWNSVADRACHHHLRLIAMGQVASLDRYLPLASYLGLGEETARVLAALGPVPGREELQLTLARLTASNGDAFNAMKHYEKWLAAHPEDHAARWEHACLKEVMARPGDAIGAFEKLLRDFPDDERAARREVTLLNRNARHRDALKRLDGLAESAFDPDTLEDYLLLSESLDEPASLSRALRIKIKKSPTPLVADYLRLAEIARGADTMDAALGLLREGVEALPEEPELRSQMAAMLLQEERFDEAVTEAMHPAAWHDHDSKLVALSACIHTRRAGEVLEALGPDFEKEDHAYNTLLDLAVAHRQAGNLQKAAQLFAQVPETPARCYRIAQAHLLARNFDEAARVAQLNLDSKTTPEAADWILLGDIRHKLGQVDEAQAAYASAVQAVTARFRLRTAALNLPEETIRR